MTSARFFSDETISSRQRMTPEGFLICADAVLARTGSQSYHYTELPDLDPNGDGWIMVERPAAEVFAPRAIGSFEGKPITVEHPAEGVGPSNWREVSVGHIAHVRRGSAPDDDVLVGDLLITDAAAIALVRHGGWRSLSCGYDARYSQDMPGRAVQHEITGNHVAILPDGGARCGPRCAIGDAAPKEGKLLSVMSMNDAEFDAVLARAFPKRKPTRDAVGGDDLDVDWERARIAKEGSQGTYEMGKRPGSPVGAEAMMVLGGELTSWFISKNDAGQVTLYRHVSENDAIRGVRTGIPTGDRAAMARLMRTRDEQRQHEQRGIAQRSRDFWKAHANG